MQKLTSHAAKLAAFILGLALLVTVPAGAQQGARERARAAVATGDLSAAAPLYAEAIKESPQDKGLIVEAGDVFMELEQYGTARDLYDRARNMDKSDGMVVRKYAEALSALGDHSRAIGVLNELLKKQDALENYLSLGRAYLASGKDSLSKAELTFQQAAQKFPNSVEVAVAQGDHYFAREVYELAQSKYEDAIALDSNLVEPRIKLGRSYREMARRNVVANDTTGAVENYNKAIAAFDKVTRISPKQARPWLELGEIYLLARDYERAARALNSYVELRPDDSRGDIMLARASYQGNYYKVTIEAMERILTRKDSASQAFMAVSYPILAKSYFQAREFAKARDTYARVPDGVLDIEQQRLYISSILFSGGDSTKALELTRKLALDNPDNCELSASYGALLYSMKRYDEVVRVLTERLAKCPEAPKGSSYLFIGLSHFAKERYREAGDALQKATEADTNNFQAYYWLMNAYARQEQFAKAGALGDVMLARRFDTTNPKEVAVAFFFRGADRLKGKDFKGAIAELERATKLNPDYAVAYLYTAYAYQTMQDKDNACKYYKLTLKADPKNEDAKKNMKTIGCK